MSQRKPAQKKGSTYSNVGPISCCDLGTALKSPETGPSRLHLLFWRMDTTAAY